MWSGEEGFVCGFWRVRVVFAVLIADGVENGGSARFRWYASCHESEK